MLRRCHDALVSALRAVPLALIGWLVCVELTSGVLQGYYVTLTPDIARHLGVTDADVNWFEAGQLLLSALMVPVLAKLGDMHGHKKMLLLSTAITAGASWWMAFAGDFWSYLIAFSLQGAYTVWLPLEVALKAANDYGREIVAGGGWLLVSPTDGEWGTTFIRTGPDLVLWLRAVGGRG